MSKSNLPNGGFSLTNGSNYMLDGFHFDTEYNDGVLDKARLPEAKGLANLPSGMIPLDGALSSDLPTGVEKESDLDLSDFTKDASQFIPLVDHSWLASLPEEDLEGARSHEEVLEHFSEGRFEHPQVNQMKALEEAWGNGQSTDGLKIIPNEQRKHEKYKNTYKNVSKLPADDYRRTVEQAQRKLAYGESLEDIMEELDSILEDDSQKQKARKKLSSEYGLLGKVYIKEECFPGIFNGRWDEVINKRCASSMYIIPSNKDCVFDRFLGMEVSKEINWKKAYNTLMPRLESCGAKFASDLNHKNRLKQAFISVIEGTNVQENSTENWFPVQNFDFELIDSQDAQMSLQASEQQDYFLESVEDVQDRKANTKLAKIAKQLVSGNFLESEQVDAVLSSDKTAQQKIDRLYDLSTQQDISKKEYRGVGQDTHYHVATKNSMTPDLISIEKKASIKENESYMKKVSKLVKAGLVSVEDVESATQGKKSLSDKYASVLNFISKPKQNKEYADYQVTEHRLTKKTRKLASLVDSEIVEGQKRWQASKEKVAKLLDAGLISKSQLESLSDIKDPELYVKKAFGIASTPEQTTEYQGESTAYVLNGNKSSKKSASENKVATWLRQKMSEGSAGKELDILLASRFSQSILQEHSARIASLRDEHEGISGHVYVDADSYMTKGTEGCEKGSLIHRANQIPSLLKTSKCNGCVFNTDGSCQKYNKPIVASAQEVVDQPKSYQKEMIRLANASDSEQTASLFVNNYDQSEFNLTANDTFNISDEAPSTEEIGEVLFGGFEI